MELSITFVGRKDELAEILAGEPGQGGLFEILGIKGAGKTELLKALEREIVEVRDDRVARIEMDSVRWGVPTVEDERADLEKEFGVFLDVLGRILRTLPEHREIDNAIDLINGFRADRPVGTVTDTSLRGGFSRITAEAPTPEPAPDADIERTARKVIDRLQMAAAALARDYAAASDQRVYLLIDAFEAIVGRTLRSWFLDLLSRLEGIVVVIASRAIKRIPLLTLPSARVFWLDGLAEPEVRQFLTAAEGVGPDVSEIVAPVMSFTEGHAQAVSLSANVIKESGGPEKSLRLLRRLAAIDAGPAQMIGPLVKEIIRSAASPEVERGLDAVLVLRRFDVESLAGVLGLDEDVASPLVQRLAEYSFVQPHANPDADGVFYTVHRFVREVGGQLLQQERPTGYHDLQLRAMEYYQSRVVDLPEEYEDWYHYEDEQWQTSLQEWLYHVSRLGREYRRQSRLIVARIFFDTFWWWGNYVSFPFCEQVLNQWSELAEVFGVPDDEAWGRQLRQVYESYPKGWRRDQDPHKWRDLHASLRWLLREGRLTGPTPDNPEERHVRGLIDIYLAEATRFLDPTDPHVDKTLADALAQFTANDDKWNLAWLAFQRADAALARGDHERAVEFVAEVTPSVATMDDRELDANLHRICADARWLRPDRDVVGAMDGYAWAVMHAYHFQVKSRADTYTQALIVEMHERAAARLTELVKSGDTDAVATVCARIRSFFDLYWRITFAPAPGDFTELLAAGRTADVVAQLFPAAPTVVDLDAASTDSRYLLTAGDYFDCIDIDLTVPPGSPLPS